MRILIPAAVLAALFACSGGETPKPMEKKAEETPAAEEAAPAEAAPAEEAAAEAAPAGDDFDAMSDEAKLAKLMELGKTVYETGGSGGLPCQTCHGPEGAGLPPTYPPLVGAQEWMGDCAKHAGYVINGLQGEIVVNGQTYNGVMPAQANLSDLEIAAVITYERNSWGNDDGICKPKDVMAAR